MASVPPRTVALARRGRASTLHACAPEATFGPRIESRPALLRAADRRRMRCGPGSTHRSFDLDGSARAARRQRIGVKHMDRNRTFAVAAGVAFIVATVAQLIGSPDGAEGCRSDARVTSERSRSLRTRSGSSSGRSCSRSDALACPAIAIALYPVLRKRRRRSRPLDRSASGPSSGALHLLIAICILLLVSVSRAWVGAGAATASAYEVAGSMVIATRAWLGPGSLLAFGLGAIMYYWGSTDRTPSDGPPDAWRSCQRPSPSMLMDPRRLAGQVRIRGRRPGRHRRAIHGWAYVVDRSDLDRHRPRRGARVAGAIPGPAAGHRWVLAVYG